MVSEPLKRLEVGFVDGYTGVQRQRSLSCPTCAPLQDNRKFQCERDTIMVAWQVSKSQRNPEAAETAQTSAPAGLPRVESW